MSKLHTSIPIATDSLEYGAITKAFANQNCLNTVLYNITDLDNFSNGILFALSKSCANTPTSGYWLIIAADWDGYTSIQVAFRYDSNAIYKRVRNKTWGNWEQIV